MKKKKNSQSSFLLKQKKKKKKKTLSRCPFGQDKSGCPKEVTSWVVDMSEYVKGIDRNHLTTVGEEGEFLVFLCFLVLFYFFLFSSCGSNQ